MKTYAMVSVAARVLVVALAGYFPRIGYGAIWTGAGGTNWNDAANWEPVGVPGTGDAVTIGSGASVLLTNATAELAALEIASGATLTVKGWQSALRATNLLIAGTVTHGPTLTAAVNGEGLWVPEHRILIQGSNLTVAATGKLDANYMGYRRMCGPGSPAPFGGVRGGAGHATDGGYSRGDAYSRGGFSYGDPAAPEQPGSGGGSNANSRAGGGAVRIILEGQLDLQGDILAEGQNGVNTHGPGGSGGSVWISARTITGTAAGLITVSGGFGYTYAGGGAAGRIAVHYDPESQAQLSEPRPPIVFEAAYGGTSLTAFYQPTFGTLHLPDALWLTESLDGRFSKVTVLPGSQMGWNPPSLTLNGAQLGFPPGFHLDVDGAFVISNKAVLHLTAAPVGDPLAQDGAVVAAGGSLNIGAGCWIHPYAEPTNGATVAFYVTNDIVVAATGGIDANAKGYSFGAGPGVAPTIYGGGGYGGRGAMGPYGLLWGPAYGSASAPRQPGSGRAKSTDFKESPGGGAIRLQAGGTVVLDGELRANGTTEGSAHTPGGSGGGIHVVCRTFQGGATGLASAAGATGAGSGGAGGGGRIAICYEPGAQASLPLPAVRFSAYAPPGPLPSNNEYYATFEAQMGTLYMPDTRWMTGVIDGNRFASVRLVIPGFTSWAPPSLAVTNAIFTLPEGFHLDVAGDLMLGSGARLHVPAAETNESSGPFGARVDVGGDLSIGAGGWLHPAAHPTNGAVVRIRVAGDVAVSAGGGIDASGLGYHPGQGPGEGGSSTSGGSHGGLGGGSLPGDPYGRAAWPVEPGSPGGWHATQLPDKVPDGGFGGGAIVLQAGGTVALDGAFDATPKRASGQTGGGTEGAGGSGGSILVLAGRRLTGGGTLDASGGLGRRNVSGGGGRIAVWPGLALAAQDSMLEGSGGTGIPASDHPAFAGTLLVDSPTGTHAAEVAGTEGTKGFYVVRGTVLLVR